MKTDESRKWPYYAADPEAYKAWMQNYWYFMIEGLQKPLGYVHASFVESVTWSDF